MKKSKCMNQIKVGINRKKSIIRTAFPFLFHIDFQNKH